MPLTTITAGMSVKNPGPTEYSSVGHSIALAVELDVQDADHARAAAKALFGEVRSMLESEIANGSPASADAGRVDLWGTSSGGNGENDHKPARRTASKPVSHANKTARGTAKGDQTAPLSNKQAKFLWQLARKSGMRTQDEVAGWLRENLGVDRGVYQLSKQEASKAIDLLNNGNGGAKR